MTIYELLKQQAQRFPEKEAIEGLSGSPLSYRSLFALTSDVMVYLRRQNVSGTDSIATAIASGPEAGTALLAISCGAAVAPLGMNLGADEYESYYTNLEARAVVLQSGVPSIARDIALRMKMRIFELTPDPSHGAGFFSLDEAPESGLTQGIPPGPTQTALILHTTGTTSRPKMVPISHENICENARTFVSQLDLGPADRSMCIMPLNHAHGLTASFLASLYSGGSVVCTPGFLAPSFFEWLEKTRATWYSAVPSMHQMIVTRVEHEKDRLPRLKLRLVRSSSSLLTEPLREKLETVFHSPVVDSYGMTEATPICYTRLPPAVRKPGSVGTPAFLEVAAIDSGGEALPKGSEGDIAVRGKTVFAGYLRNPEADAKAFRNGWFLTGDIGKIDEEGFVYLTGRSKEIINHGGEKISPYEIEAVLLSHPAVYEAVVFAVPDPQTGESVGAAVTLRTGTAENPERLLDFVSAKIAANKVPKYFRVVTEIPRGSTGKFKRVDLANQLGISASTLTVTHQGQDAFQASAKMVGRMQEIWREVLQLESVRPSDDFFAIGGDSILGNLLLTHISRTFGVNFPPRVLYSSPILSELAGRVEQEAKSSLKTQLPDRIPVVSREGLLPTSLWQDRWLTISKKSPGINSEMIAWHLIPYKLDIEIFKRSVDSAIRRHEICSASFVETPSGFHHCLNPHDKIELPHVDLRGKPKDVQKAAMFELVAREVDFRFDSSTPPLWRIHLVSLAQNDHRLLLNFHHAISDFWSKSVLMRDIVRIYSAFLAGREPTLPDLPIQFIDYASWQRKTVFETGYEEKKRFWDKHLTGSPVVCILGDVPQSQSTSDHLPVSWNLSPESFSGLKKISNVERVGLFALLQTAFCVTWREMLKGQHEEFIYICATSLERERQELLNVVGPIASGIPMKIRLNSEMTAREALKHVHDIYLTSCENALPSPLFQPHYRAMNKFPRMMLSYLGSMTEFAESSAEIAIVPSPVRPFVRVKIENSGADIYLQYIESSKGELWGTATYNKNQFGNGSAVHQFMASYKRFLEELSTTPEHFLGRPLGNQRERSAA